MVAAILKAAAAATMTIAAAGSQAGKAGNTIV
jgi:hypothetical protein